MRYEQFKQGCFNWQTNKGPQFTVYTQRGGGGTGYTSDEGQVKKEVEEQLNKTYKKL